jgi:hypothetical protein
MVMDLDAHEQSAYNRYTPGESDPLPWGTAMAFAPSKLGRHGGVKLRFLFLVHANEVISTTVKRTRQWP